jgi:hypothetical protein
MQEKSIPKPFVSLPSSMAGIRATESFRSIDEGIIATYRPAVCFRGVEREASTLYVTINPSNVPEALKATHERYYK